MHDAVTYLINYLNVSVNIIAIGLVFHYTGVIKINKRTFIFILFNIIFNSLVYDFFPYVVIVTMYISWFIYAYIRNRMFLINIMVLISSYLIFQIISVIPMFYSEITGVDLFSYKNEITFNIMMQTIIITAIILLKGFLNFAGDKMIEWCKNPRYIISFIFYVVCLCTMCAFLANVVSFENLYDILTQESIQKLFSTFILVVLLISMGIIYLINHIQKIINKKEQEKNNYKLISLAADDINHKLAEVKHDSKKLLVPLAGYFDNNNFEEAKRYFNMNIRNDIFLLDKLSASVCNLTKLEVESLTTLFCYYYIEIMKNRNISMIFSIFDKIDKINMKEKDLLRIIGIFLENSIEECEKFTEHVEIVVSVCKYSENNSSGVIITVSNPIFEGEIDLSKIFDRCYSTKNRNSGNGLAIVTKIIGKNDNTSLETRCDDNKLTHILTIADEC